MSTTSPARRLFGISAVLAFITIGGLAGCSTSSSDDTATSTTTAEPTIDGSDGTDGATSTTDGEASTTTDGNDPVTTTTAPSSPTTSATRPGGDDEAAYIDAMREYLADDDDVFGPEAIDCMANGLVRLICVDRFRSGGVDPADAGDPFDELDLDAGTAGEMFEILDDCSGGIRDKMVEAFTKDAGPGSEACIDRELTDEVVREVFVSAFQGEEPSDELFAKLGACS